MKKLFLTLACVLFLTPSIFAETIKESSERTLVFKSATLDNSYVLADFSLAVVDPTVANFPVTPTFINAGNGTYYFKYNTGSTLGKYIELLTPPVSEGGVLVTSYNVEQNSNEDVIDVVTPMDVKLDTIISNQGNIESKIDDIQSDINNLVAELL